MQILLVVGYYVLFCLLIRYLPFFRNLPGLSTARMLTFFTLKVLTGTLLVVVYTYYYDTATADIYKYYYDGLIMFQALGSHPLEYLKMLSGIGPVSDTMEQYYSQMLYWYRPFESVIYNDSRLVIRFNALVALFSFDSIYVHNVFINFLSFAGLVALYRFVRRYVPERKAGWLPWGIFLFPSLVFWGSGLLKEGLLLWSFGFWVYLADQLFHKPLKQPLFYPFFLFFSFILFLLKPYTLVFWLPCFIAFYWSLRDKNVWMIQMRYAVVLLGFVLSALLLGYTFPQWDAVSIIVNKQNDFVTFSRAMEAGSLMHQQYLTESVGDFLLFFVKGLGYSFFRPHLLETYSLFTLIAALENLMILALVLYMLVRMDRQRQVPMFWLGVWFSVLLMGFVGMISPAHGGLVRYKIPALPFIWICFVLLARLPETQSLGAQHLKKSGVWLTIQRFFRIHRHR